MTHARHYKSFCLFEIFWTRGITDTGYQDVFVFENLRTVVGRVASLNRGYPRQERES